ncbi:MAG: hypothetical protein ACOCU6_00335 [Nanoarchaeota archaeon]
MNPIFNEKPRQYIQSIEKIAQDKSLLEFPIVFIKGEHTVWTNGSLAVIDDPNMDSMLKKTNQELPDGLYTFNFSNNEFVVKQTTANEVRERAKSINLDYDTISRIKGNKYRLLEQVLESDNLYNSLEHKINHPTSHKLDLNHNAVMYVTGDEERLSEAIAKNKEFKQAILNSVYAGPVEQNSFNNDKLTNLSTGEYHFENNNIHEYMHKGLSTTQQDHNANGIVLSSDTSIYTFNGKPKGASIMYNRDKN